MTFIITLTVFMIALLGWLYFMLKHPDFTIEIGSDQKLRITGLKKHRSD